MSLEGIDRRLFLRGLMLTSAGLVVPRPVITVGPHIPDYVRFDIHAPTGRIMAALGYQPDLRLSEWDMSRRTLWANPQDFGAVARMPLETLRDLHVTGGSYVRGRSL